jgi:hypothetical protein
MFISLLALLAAIILSFVSGYFSIIGLTTLFAGAFWPIVIMGTSLEFAKLVTASWLYRNWVDCSAFLKTYLTSAVIILIVITSMGVFGFLSKAHIEQQLKMSTGVQDQIEILDSKITFAQQNIADTDVQLGQIDNAIAKLNDKGQAKSSLQAMSQQKKSREELVSKKEQQINVLSDLKMQKIKLDSELKIQQAEVGPLKFIAELIYGQDNAQSHFDSAVRAVIIILVVVFDPLAVILLIAANQGLTNTTKRSKIPLSKPDYKSTARKKRGRPKKVIELQTDSILKM